MTVLVSGVAGFIGYHVAKALIAKGDSLIGIDNLNAYYDIRLKKARIARLEEHPEFSFYCLDIANFDALSHLFSKYTEITQVIHLAAQAGVRYSLADPFAYIQTNVVGHLAILEAARRLPNVRHFVYASSSSVYGDNRPPFVETDRVDRPRSIYAASKRSAELVSEVCAYLHGFPQTGLRFFTVYGPWGRPDMAYFRFADAMMTGRPITLFDSGNLRRDFTFISDVVDAVLAIIDHPPDESPPHRILNIGNSNDQPVTELLRLLEEGLGRQADIRWSARPRADAEQTHASTEAMARLVGWRPATGLRDGIMAFVAWYRDWFDENGVSAGEPFAAPGLAGP